MCRFKLAVGSSSHQCLLGFCMLAPAQGSGRVVAGLGSQPVTVAHRLAANPNSQHT